VATSERSAVGVSTKRLTKKDLEYAKLESRTRLGLAIISMVKWVFFGAFIFFTVRELAGRSTLADIRVLGNFSISEVLSMGTTVFTGWGWYRERKRNADLLARFGPVAAAREKALDAGRSSSRLTIDGLTNPEED